MIDIYVCVGSACHLKGSYSIINRLQELVGNSKHAEQINLMAVLCFGRCGGDVAVRIGEDEYFSMRPEDTDSWFEANILPRLEN